MTTQRGTIERLLNKEEILYWARKNNVSVREFSGGLHVDEWTVMLDQEDRISSVEMTLDVPREL